MNRRSVLLALGCVLGLALAAAWLARFRVADALVDARLATARVPASYRITRIGPFLERMEDVRIGDPAAPDLVARRVDVTVGYGLSGPVVRAVRVEGVRLRARIDRNGLTLGAIDRLMPKATGGRTRLPDLDVALRDTIVLLATPNGAIRAAMTGNGNPLRRFRGRARIAGPALRLASCALNGVAADLAIEARAGKPRADGPVRIAATRCPGLTLGAGAVRIAASANATFDRVALQATFADFGGRAGTAQFARVTGTANATGMLGDLTAQARIGLAALSLPAASQAVARSGALLAGTPLGPVGARAGAAAARLLDKSDASAALAIAIRGLHTDVALTRLDLAGRDGAHLTAVARGGMTWTAQGWRADADIATGGGALPVLTAKLRQAASGARLAGIVRLRPYRAGDARLAATPVRFAWNGARADFATILTIDGAVSDGIVRGLTMPMRGYATAAGALAIGQGCQTLAFGQLRLASFTFDAASVPVCGDPIVARRAGGSLRIAAATGAVRLTGRTADGAPLTLTAAGLHLTQAGFRGQQVTASLGKSAQPTRLAIDALDGAFDGNRIGGRFAGAAGAIGNVPLAISGADGSWSLAGATLAIAGALRVTDTGARFNPLVTDDVLVGLTRGTITARATLREPGTKTAVARVDLRHALASGTGGAVLTVPGLRFAPKGLQPEALTPLTLGVIANVAGRVSGSARIDWSPGGVTSSGDFATDRIDLAAAFGPVTGLAGALHFTDLLGLVSAPAEATVAEINPGVVVSNGVVRYQLIGANRVQVSDAHWPFAGGTLRLDPTILDFSGLAERHLAFRIDRLDAAAFVQQLDFPNISATGTFDGVLPMSFDQMGGRIEGGSIRARGGGTLAYVGELSNAQLGTMGMLAFDALKAIRYSSLDISLDGKLDGEMVSRVRFQGVREATPNQSLVTRLIRNLPFRFNIAIRAPFRALVGSARAYIDPRLLLKQLPPAPPVQPPASAPVR